MHEHRETLRTWLRLMGTPGNAGLIHAVPDTPGNATLVRWHLNRSLNSSLLDQQRDLHLRTWRQLIELESDIANAMAKLYMKGM